MSNSGLEDLLRLYTQVVGEVRALDAEKKALVYDNYSKLITATETIRKVFISFLPLGGFIYIAKMLLRDLDTDILLCRCVPIWTP